mmetsp:Transcript_30741/g.89442  ORF Transcript_30741/g.89442 Transcript_30741/m.89442 type:complete len:236 (+) Transcript_30741:36-743(+)
MCLFCLRFVRRTGTWTWSMKTSRLTFRKVLDEGVVEVGISILNPSVKNDRTLDGFDVEVVELILAELSKEYEREIKANFTIIDNSEIFFEQFREALNEGTADILTFFTGTAERAESVDFRSCSILNFVNEIGVWVLEDSDLTAIDLTADPNALEEKRIGVCDGCFFIDALTEVAPGLELVEFPVDELVPALREGQVEGVATLLRSSGPGFNAFVAAEDLVKLDGSFVVLGLSVPL